MKRCAAISVERVRLGEELEHRLVPAGDHGVELVEQTQELLAALDHALVVERDVEVGVARRGPARS